MTLDPRYVSDVLNENFEDAKTLFLGPLIAIHHAHLAMLTERGIVSAGDAAAIRAGLSAISPEAVLAVRYDGTCEDLFFYVERLLTAACGEEIAGRLHTARSRNDVDMTMYRMRLREFILALIEAANELRRVLIGVASGHRNTIFAAHTHTQPAQPTSLAHYLLAVIEQLSRDVSRLRAAFHRTNESPLGSCAITGTGFDIDRGITSALLGFDRPTRNTYGSIATVDYILEAVSSAAVLLAGLGRVIQDLLLWCTPEFGYLRLSDGFVQTSSIMPQKRNPVALEHARAIASRTLGQASAVFVAVHNTPFGDIVDTEDDLQPLVASTLQDARRVLSLLGAALATAEFDASHMAARAGEGGTTYTELADHLARTHGIPFKHAHDIAARLLAARRARPDDALAGLLALVSAEVLGAPLAYSDADLATILSARHFIEVRRTPGGPAPDETRRALSESALSLAEDDEWLTTTRGGLSRAEDELRRRSASGDRA